MKSSVPVAPVSDFGVLQTSVEKVVFTYYSAMKFVVKKLQTHSHINTARFPQLFM